jgi:hypothetical protein
MDLLFSESPAPDGNLVFGATGGVGGLETVTLVATLPALRVTGAVADVKYVTMVAVLPSLQASGVIQYDSLTARPDVGQVASFTKIAQPTGQGSVQTTQLFQVAVQIEVGAGGRFEDGVLATSGSSMGFTEAVQASMSYGADFQDGTAVQSEQQSKFQDGSPTCRTSETSMFQDGVHADKGVGNRFQDGIRDRRANIASRHQEAKRTERGVFHRSGRAVPRNVARGGRFQDAWVPRPGVSPTPTTPVVPPLVLGTVLLFQCPPLGMPNLVFGGITPCDVAVTGTVVVPIRRVYMVVNNATLCRVDGNINLPTFGMSLSLDVDSWTWGFSATLPGTTLADLEPSSGGAPVEVEATINGVAYRALVESISRNRTFGKDSLTVQGRGKTALLDAPYSPILAFGNSGGDRTAQQLMGDVLTVNNVSMGWAVNWGLDDWLVPTGVFSHQGSYISALNQIAGAAGGYIQPHASGLSISVLPRYPLGPWDWSAADYVLPSALTTQESIAWVEKPRYNRVFVSGVQQGILAQISRANTLGDILAPMITDALITETAAARQRGLSVLSNTGRIATVNLKLPVLPATGVITPGKMVSYVDGATTRLGIVRSTSVDVGTPEIWQTIGVETHV